MSGSLRRREWLRPLARLGDEDLRRVSRLIDALIVAAPADKAAADAMLDAGPEPESLVDARARVEAVIARLGGALS